MNTSIPQSSNIETYTAVAMSTGHLSEEDKALLSKQAKDPGCSRIMEREYGFFIKVPGEPADVGYNLIEGGSKELNRIIIWAMGCGFQMIEFDADANYIDGFAVQEQD